MHPDLFPPTPSDTGLVQVRCLSLWQPWASLMAIGAKTIETRDWNTIIRGQVFIHAGQSFKGLRECEEIHHHHIAAMERALGIPFDEWARKLPFGKLIARGNLISTLPGPEALRCHPLQEPFGNFAEGRFGHLYESLTPIEFIPLRAGRKFFFAQVPAHLSQAA